MRSSERWRKCGEGTHCGGPRCARAHTHTHTHTHHTPKDLVDVFGAIVLVSWLVAAHGAEVEIILKSAAAIIHTDDWPSKCFYGDYCSGM